jgi:hypothetical protein
LKKRRQKGGKYHKYALKERQKREDVRDKGEQSGRVEKWKNRRKNVMKEIDNWIIIEGKDERLEIGKKQLRKKMGKGETVLVARRNV